MREKIERWYKQGLWSAAMVQAAADKGIITRKAAADILGEV